MIISSRLQGSFVIHGDSLRQNVLSEQISVLTVQTYAKDMGDVEISPLTYQRF